MKRFNDFVRRSVSALFVSLVLAVSFSASVSAQTTAFTYQGRFTDTSTNPPTINGSYTMTFKLYDTDGTESAGNLIGTQSAMVSVVNGIFSVKLDFGATAFNTTSARYLQIEVGSTVLTPRQEITATPFSLRTTNAANADALSNACVGCVTSGQINSVDGSKITGTISSATVTNATNASNFTGTLSGNVTGTQNATVVATVGGQTAANIASTVTTVGSATNLNTANAIVKRDGSGNFTAGQISATTFNGSLNGNATTATNFNGNLSGDVTGTQSATVVSRVGGRSSTQISTSVTETINATSNNTPNTIVKRDASGKISFNGFLRSAAGTFDSNCVNVDGSILVGTNNNNGTCNVTIPAGTVDGFPLIFASRTTYLGGSFQGNGSGVATITRPPAGDYGSVLVLSAGPFAVSPRTVNTDSANSSQSSKSEGEIKTRNIGVTPPKP